MMPRPLPMIILLLFLQTALLGSDRPRGAVFDDLQPVRFPAVASVIDVTKAPYFAKGDGKTDNTDALQKALFDVMGRSQILYFPNGTYLVSRMLTGSKKNSRGEDAWGRNWLQGESASKTIIRLKDGVFRDPSQPQSILWCGGFGSADWFHNYIQDITFDVGADNAGAIGLQFYSNNSGAIRNCRIVASEGSALIGLDLGHRDMNGPLLVTNCEVVGFQKGIATSHAVNGQTFEHITLRGQLQFGFINEGQSVSIRGLLRRAADANIPISRNALASGSSRQPDASAFRLIGAGKFSSAGLLSENRVPAVQTYGSCCLIDSTLNGVGDPAIINFNGGHLLVRDV